MLPALLLALLLAATSLMAAPLPRTDQGTGPSGVQPTADQVVAAAGIGDQAAPVAAAPVATASTAAPRFPDPAERLRILTGHRIRPAEANPPAEESRRGASGRAHLQSPPPNTEDDYDVRYTSLDLDITDTAGRRIQGKVAHRIESLSSSLTQVVLDLVNVLVVDSVRVNGQPSTFTHASNQVRIDLPSALPVGQSATVRIAYRGQPPQNGLGLRFDSHNGQAFVWNLSEPDGGKFWWPCKDHPYDKADSADIRITTPDWMSATSNGTLVSVQTQPGIKIYNWHCSYPISSYLIPVTAGNFVRLDSVYPIPGGGTMPLRHYVFPEQQAQATVDFSIAPDAINAFADRFGPYPFLREKYGITVFGWGGGMEHQTNTSYGWSLIDGQHSFDWIYVHELSHQWWGDNVTCATWADCWLNEGFASYCEAIWQEDQHGFSAYRDYMVNVQGVFDPSGPVYNFSDPFDGNTIYNKGAWVLHMLRGAIGDAAFFSGMNSYRDLYQGRNATTEQFRAVMEAASGRDLGWFFNEWVYGMNRPHYLVSSMNEPVAGGRRVYVHLDQTQTDAGFFTMPVRIRITAGGTFDYTLYNDPDHDDLVADVPVTPTAIAVDSDQWILRTVNTGAYRLNLVSADLPAADATVFVEVPLVARGGTTPYTWGLVDPAPSGIGLDTQSGVLRGTPENPGSYAFRVLVRDSSAPARADTARLFWTINPSPTETTDIPAPVASRVLRSYPNPATREVLITFRDSDAAGSGAAGGARGAGLVEWAVFDLSGRQVASNRIEARPNQEVLSWRWDGRDAAGRALPTGAYLIRAREERGSGPARVLTGRVFWVR